MLANCFYPVVVEDGEIAGFGDCFSMGQNSRRLKSQVWQRIARVSNRTGNGARPKMEICQGRAVEEIKPYSARKKSGRIRTLKSEKDLATYKDSMGGQIGYERIGLGRPVTLCASHPTCPPYCLVVPNLFRFQCRTRPRFLSREVGALFLRRSAWHISIFVPTAIPGRLDTRRISLPDLTVCVRDVLASSRTSPKPAISPSSPTTG